MPSEGSPAVSPSPSPSPQPPPPEYSEVVGAEDAEGDQRSGTKKADDDSKKVCFSNSVVSIPASDNEFRDFIDETIPAGLRLYEKAVESHNHKKRIEQQTEMMHEKELQNAKTARPRLSKKARDDLAGGRRNFPQFLDDQSRWLGNLKANLERKVQDAEDHFKTKRQEADFVDKQSKRIITRKKARGDYEGPVKGWKNGFSNYVRAKNRAPPEVEETFEPQINRSSKMIIRDEPAHERLHAMAAEREESLIMLRAWEYDKSMIDPQTGAPRFHPKVLSSPRAEVHYENSRLRNSGAFNQDFDDTPSLSSSQQFCKKRGFNELMRHLHSRKSTRTRSLSAPRETTYSFAPQINPTSALILEKCGPRPPLYQMTSSLMSWGSRSPSKSVDDRLEAMTPPTYVSAQRQRTRTPDQKRVLREKHNSFMARQARDQYEKQSRKRDLERDIRVKELKDCTFHPTISERSNSIFSQSQYSKLGSVKGPPSRRSHSEGRVKVPQSEVHLAIESETASFIRKLEEEHAADQEAAKRVRQSRSASPAAHIPRTPMLPVQPQDYADEEPAAPPPKVLFHDSVPKQSVPSPTKSPPAPSPFLNKLHEEFKGVLEGWKESLTD
eukprot:TRINITY_DN10034_c0_g1_i1.p1 TRINITY_DN10034_c0_g1~~TRINITY_DN10034_c0_g1_i1.p1  ORF type:complete len:610 (+),score=108.85 TRINITY_DN10034_c0_g1_i1:40-1869(+)